MVRYKNDLECVVRVSRNYDSVPDEMFWKILEPSGASTDELLALVVYSGALYKHCMFCTGVQYFCQYDARASQLLHSLDTKKA